MFSFKKNDFSNKILIVFSIILMIFIYVNSQCATFFPRTASQCFNYSDEENFCCHLTRFEDKNAYSICYKIPVTKYAEVSDIGYMMLGINNYTTINCGSVAGATCRYKEPLIPDDCYEFNDNNSNCCMVEVPERKKRCVFSGNKLSSYYTTENGITIKCGEK